MVVAYKLRSGRVMRLLCYKHIRPRLFPGLFFCRIQGFIKSQVRHMKKINIQTRFKKILSDIYTPVGIYLRIRDRFRDTVLLESTDYHAAENSYSFICIHAIGGVEISDARQMEFKLPGRPDRKISIEICACTCSALGFHGTFRCAKRRKKNRLEQLRVFLAIPPMTLFVFLTGSAGRKTGTASDSAYAIPLLSVRDCHQSF